MGVPLLQLQYTCVTITKPSMVLVPMTFMATQNKLS